MYLILLALHSLTRWVVLVSMVFAIMRAYRGWLLHKNFTRLDNFARHVTATTAHIQLILGLWLYFLSPIVNYFLHHTGTAMRQREMRFFGMEHITMMLIAITVITIGSYKAKRKPTDKEKFKTMAIWYTIGLLTILSSIPWSFSPLISRPLFRWF